MSGRTEGEIRDFLADNLALIEAGLVLIKKEEYLPNDKGASGFIDIFAKDKDGKLVVIEIKKSDAAARQAVQELSKYAALLKNNRLIKETEYKLLVLSTEWHELLTPFSEFVHATKYDCEGMKIVLGQDGLPTAVEAIQLLAPARTRKFSPRHFIWEFMTEAKALASVKPTAEFMQEVGLHDFILAVLTLNDPTEGVSHLLYFAQQELTFEEYYALIKKRFSAESIEEFDNYIADLTEPEDRIGEAADKVWEPADDEDRLYEKIRPSGAQISHPEKADYWFSPDKAVVKELHRFGQFDDEFLPDETIVSELKGTQSGSEFRLNMVASVKSRPEMAALTKASDNVFFFNQKWRTSVRDLIAYAKGTGAVSIRLKAFNQDDIFSTIAGLAIGYPGFVPGFEIEITWGDRSERYSGGIGWERRKPDFAEILQEYFDADDFGYFLHRHLGSHRGMNADLMGELGLVFETWKDTGDEPVRIRVHGNSIAEIKRSHTKSLIEFLEGNEEFVGSLVNLFLKSDMSFQQLLTSQMDLGFKSAEAQLAKQIDPNSDHSIEWLGDAEKCDLCKRPFETANFLVDAHIKQGCGATICATCFEEHGTGIGWGKGQLYKKNDDKWILVAGGRPNDGDDE